MRRLIAVVLVIVLFGAFGEATMGEVKAVWAVGDGEKVMRDNTGHPCRAGNSVWDGKVVSLLAAKNEIVAFQVIVEAGEGRIERLSVALDGLIRKGGGGQISYHPPAPDPTDYVGRPIRIFSLNYMSVIKPSAAGWVFRPGSPAAPKDALGWTPVQIVPENATAGKGGFPLSVAAGSSQSVWIEIYTARDLPAGVYDGTVVVTADGESLNVPVTIEVLDFALPDKNSMNAMVYWEEVQGEIYQGHRYEDRYHRFAHRNRIELVNTVSIREAVEDTGLFDGSDFAREKGYEGPGVGVGNVIMPASFYNTPRSYDDRETAWKLSDAWMEFLAKEYPRAVTFLYMPDEPTEAQYARIRNIAENIHSNKGPGGKLPIFATIDPKEELEGAIDVWCVGVGWYNLDVMAGEIKKGRRGWVYNGGRPGGGAVIIDSPATDPREIIWACFKHDIGLYFYWHGNQWRHNSQKQGERLQNVWADPVTFDNVGQPRKPVEHQGRILGDGVLFYPGTEKLHPEEDRGIEGPCSTVQLANIRRGLQDHLYLTMARELGLDEVVDEALAAVVPRVFSDAGEEVGFSEREDDYENARRKVGRAIADELSGRDK